MMYEYRIIGIPKVIDGDTLDVVFDVGFKIHTWERCRLLGIDAPESRTTDLKEKQYGIAAKQFVEDWLKRHPNLWGRTTKDDKYGRMLVEVFADGLSTPLNTLMITEGYAWAYMGETKVKDFKQLDERRAAAVNSFSAPEAS
jgi:micrococcal nuclease